MNLKKCFSCKLDLPLNNFSKKASSKDRLYSYCRKCKAIKSKISRTIHHEQEALRKKRNVENNRDRYSSYYKQYHQKNKEKRLSTHLFNYRNNELYKKKHNLRVIIRRCIKNMSKRDLKRIPLFFGCTPIELRTHIESLFKHGMSWDNVNSWHIDHIIPLNKAQTIKEAIDLCFYKNLQPLWPSENMKKGSKGNDLHSRTF